MKNKGITLVALVITIIVLLILSGVTISALSGENGIITNAVKAKKMTTLSQCKEEYEMFITEEMIKNNKFQKTSLVAGENNLYFNTQKAGEVGNIFNVIPSLKNNEYSKKLEIIKGDLLLNTKDQKEIELAQSVGIKPNPYDIVNGELLSSDGNLLLMDETGTVTIPDRVTKIGDGAFRGVDGLKTIIIPGTVKEIGDHAFSGNATLENVIIEEGVEKIGNSAFERCKELKNFKMPDTITEIGGNTFLGCNKLFDINISKSVSVIQNGVFEECSSLQEIVLPERITEIKWSAFASCVNLRKINIPKNCTYIDGSAFCWDDNLINIDIDKENLSYCFYDNMIMSKNKDTIAVLLSSANELNIPKSVTTILSRALSGNIRIKTINIPENVTKIYSSFSEAVEKINVDINNKFYKSINGNLYDITGERLIKYCTNDEIVNLPEGLKIIQNGSFEGQYNIKKLNLSESVEKIEDWAIGSWSKDIYIGKSLNYISSLGIRGNNNITISPENPNYMTPDGTLILSKDGKNLCAVAKDLASYNIPSTVENIKGYSFYKMYQLIEFKLPMGIKNIESSAFEAHFGLKKVEIPSSIQKIAANAFQDCSNLKEIIIDKTKDSISGSPWGNPFGLRAVKWLE